MGFSPLGLAFSVLLLLPSAAMLLFPPRQPLPRPRVPRSLRAAESAGQALSVVLPIVLPPGQLRAGWAVVVVGALLGYYVLWGRYLVSGRAVRALYAPFCGLPVPMAVLPVVAVLAAALWLDVAGIAVAGVILAIGHLPTSAAAARALRQTGPSAMS
jgi:hypothetical protein